MSIGPEIKGGQETNLDDQRQVFEEVFDEFDFLQRDERGKPKIPTEEQDFFTCLWYLQDAIYTNPHAQLSNQKSFLDRPEKMKKLKQARQFLINSLKPWEKVSIRGIAEITKSESRGGVPEIDIKTVCYAIWIRAMKEKYLKLEELDD